MTTFSFEFVYSVKQYFFVVVLIFFWSRIVIYGIGPKYCPNGPILCNPSWLAGKSYIIVLVPNHSSQLSSMVCAPMNLWYIAFTQYPNRYLYPTFSESDSYHIRYSLFVSVTETIRIRLCIRTLSVSEFESERNMKTNIILVISVRIRSVFIPSLW